MPPTRVLISGSPASSASWATSARASQVEVSRARSAAREQRAAGRPDDRAAGPAAARRRSAARAPAARAPRRRPRTAGPPGPRTRGGDVQRACPGSSAAPAGRTVSTTGRPADSPSRARAILAATVADGQRRGGDRSQPSPARPEPDCASATRSLLAPRVRSAPRATSRCSTRAGPSRAVRAEHGVVPGDHQRYPDDPARPAAPAPPALIAVRVHDVGARDAGPGRSAAAPPDPDLPSRWRGAVTAGQNTRTVWPAGHASAARCWPRAGRSPRCWRVSTCAIFMIDSTSTGAAAASAPRAGRAARARSSRSTPTKITVAEQRPARSRPASPPAGRRRPAAEPATAQAPAASDGRAGTPASIGRASAGRPAAGRTHAGPAASRRRRRRPCPPRSTPRCRHQPRQRHQSTETASTADDHHAPSRRGHQPGGARPVLGQQGPGGQPEQANPTTAGAKATIGQASAAVRPEPGPSTNTRATGTAVADQQRRAEPGRATITTGPVSASTAAYRSGTAARPRRPAGERSVCSSGAASTAYGSR